MINKYDNREIVETMFAATIEAIRMRDQEWREWWDTVAKEAGLCQSWIDNHTPPPDRRD
jgi:hypothetical protein